MIIFLAYQISRIQDDLTDFKKGFLPTLGLGLIPLALVVLQPDIGTASVLFAILFGILFLGEAKLQHMALLAGAGIGGFVLMINVAPYRAARFMTFLHPELDQLGVGYHINQAFLAIGSGGWLGRGLWGSVRKYEFLPEVNADSIFAIMAEEIGFLFTVAFIVLIMLICFRGLRIAKNAPDVFSKLLVSGIIIWFVSQSFFLCSFLPNNYFNMCALHLNSSFPARTPSCFSPVCLGTTELCSDWGFVARGFNQRRERRRLSRS